MSETTQIHASLVAIGDKGVLLCGKSGKGKSDLALRLIENKSAQLVADDVVDLFISEDVLYGKAPDKLKGLLEVRGVGIFSYKYLDKIQISLIVNLVDDMSMVERLPLVTQKTILGVNIEEYNLCGKEVSASEKILLMLRDKKYRIA